MGRRVVFGILFVVSTAAVLTQLWLFLLGSGWTIGGVVQAVGLFLFFFTHLTNAAIAVAAGRLAWRFDGLSARPAAAMCWHWRVSSGSWGWRSWRSTGGRQKISEIRRRFSLHRTPFV